MGKIELLVDGKVEMTCYSEYVAMNNHYVLVRKYGKDRVSVRRSK